MSDVTVPPPTGPQFEVGALMTSQEAMVHTLVAAPFGDMEYDVGKSVHWTQWFSDDVFITDVNLGDPRYWIVNWEKTFPEAHHSVTGINYFVRPVDFRKEQFAMASKEPGILMEPEDWVLFVDAHEGLNIDTRLPQPNDVLTEMFRSYIYREISRANTAGKDRVVLPFYVFLRHDNLITAEYPSAAYADGATGFTTAAGTMGTPYYLKVQGLTRLMKVSVLQNPAFDWTTIDQPSAPDTGKNLAIVSYGYAHWHLQDIVPPATEAPPLSEANDDGWRMRKLLSQVRPIPSLPYDVWSPPAGAEQRIAVPSYFWVTWYNPVGGAHEWERMQASTPTQEFAICNINSGPGTAIEQDWVRQINDAHAAGLKVIGYVRTNYWNKPVAEAKAEIDKYYAWYGIDGIFLDEVAWEDEKQYYYLDLYNYVKAKTGPRLVVINPGTADAHEIYMGCCDIMMNFEASATEYLAQAWPAWVTKYSPSRFWHVIHDVTGTAQRDTLLARTITNRAGYVYLTMDSTVTGDQNPYNSLPADPFWSGMVTAVEAATIQVEPTGLAGPWAPADINTPDPIQPQPVTPDPTLAGLLVGLYDNYFRLNMRDGVWYEGGELGNIPLAWNPTTQKWVPRDMSPQDWHNTDNWVAETP